MNLGNQGEWARLVWEEFYNESGEQIPAFACLRITGMTTLGGRNIVKVAKPNTYGSQYMHRLNGPLPVEIGKYGICTCSPGAAALYDTADGTPGFLEQWGPRNATWKLKKNTGGWSIMGNPDSTNGIVIVQQAPMLSFLGKTDSTVVKSASVTVSIYAGTGGPGAETDTTVNMTNVYSRYGDIGSSKWVRCYLNDASSSPYWECIDAECT